MTPCKIAGCHLASKRLNLSSSFSALRKNTPMATRAPNLAPWRQAAEPLRRPAWMSFVPFRAWVPRAPRVPSLWSCVRAQRACDSLRPCDEFQAVKFRQRAAASRAPAQELSVRYTPAARSPARFRAQLLRDRRESCSPGCPRSHGLRRAVREAVPARQLERADRTCARPRTQLQLAFSGSVGRRHSTTAPQS